MRQLALPFIDSPQLYQTEDFCPASSNEAAREWLARKATWSNGRLIIWGEAGCGKSHLLHMWARTNAADVIEGTALRGLVRTQAPLAIDNADLVPEPASLLHLLNAAAEEGMPVLMATRLAPSRLSYTLADLTSRLRASANIEIGAPEDDLLDALLTRLAAMRQLNLPPAVHNALRLYLPRTPASYREAIARLDRLALDRGMKITRAMASEVLHEINEHV